MNTLVACENEQLLDAALQVYSRSCMYGTESQHVAAVKYRAEILRRLNTRSPAVSPPSVVAVGDVVLPELPPPADAYALAAWGPKPDYYTTEQMEAYARTALESFAQRIAGSGERDAVDAARYRFLRNGGWEVLQDPKYWTPDRKFDGAIDAAQLDVALDAAIAQQSKRGGA